jgi:hypothetical protein
LHSANAVVDYSDMAADVSPRPSQEDGWPQRAFYASMMKKKLSI